MGLPTLLRRVALAALLFLPLPSTGLASEVLCDPAFQDCRAMLLARIQKETDAIEIAMLFMEDDALADAIIARHAVGVRVRILVEPRRNMTTPKNEIILERLKAAGIPMRAKSGGGMLHWKFMLFNAQNVVEFSAANYSDYYFKPTVPYANYTDEGIFFSDQGSIVDSFRRKFEDAWTDTVGFFDYGNISGTPVRLYPLYSIDPDLSFVPAENFATRSVPLYDAEQQRIDTIMYKITESRHADGLIRAVKRGLPVRVITEPERYRNRSNMWQAYHIDRLYAAGVQIRDRAHEGFLHQKSTLLYGQGLTIFGSSNWTSESNSSQYEHNYFTDKAWFFDWFRDNFERKWTNRTGTVETVPFQPLPPDVPVYVSPASGATNIATSGVVLKWNPGIWSWKADIYFGTSATPPLLKADHAVSAGQSASFTLPALAAGTRYYWKIVSKTMAQQTAEGPVYSFTTAGDTEPEPNSAPTVAITAPSNNSTFTAPATIGIAASASDSDGTVVRVEFYSGTTRIGSDLTAPFQFTWSSVPAGSYSLTARAFDDDGAATTSSAIAITVAAADTSLPAPWQSQDIGSVGLKGSAQLVNGTFTVSGAGADVWGTADAFHFAWQRVSGDVEIVARVATVQNINAWTKAGVMIRSALTANASHAFLLVSPGKGRAFQRRATTGGITTHTAGGSGTAPVWMKLERRGTTVRASLSADGKAWTLVASDTIALGTDAYVGLAVSSHDTSRLAAATFDGVSVTSVTAPALPAPWSGQDIGAVGVAGSAAAADGIFTIKGAGADVWGTADAFQFVWQPVDGDADVVARVASVQYVQAWVKAGVMIRERLAADSPHAFMIVSAGKGLAFQRRVASGGLSTHTSGGAGNAPAWVKLERRGNVISAFVSADGANWTFVGRDTFSMGARVYVGLAVSSHDATRLATATFDGVIVKTP